jgi:hypothetical protein
MSRRARCGDRSVFDGVGVRQKRSSTDASACPSPCDDGATLDRWIANGRGPLAFTSPEGPRAQLRHGGSAVELHAGVASTARLTAGDGLLTPTPTQPIRAPTSCR